MNVCLSVYQFVYICLLAELLKCYWSDLHEKNEKALVQLRPYEVLREIQITAWIQKIYQRLGYSHLLIIGTFLLRKKDKVLI